MVTFCNPLILDPSILLIPIAMPLYILRTKNVELKLFGLDVKKSLTIPSTQDLETLYLTESVEFFPFFFS